jgi:hypothetical protein
MELNEENMLSEISQIQKDKYHMFSLTYVETSKKEKSLKAE